MAQQSGILLNVNLDDHGFRDVLRRAPRRTADLIERGIRRYSRQIVFEARQELTRIRNPRLPSSKYGEQKGGLGQSITASEVKRSGDRIYCRVSWGKPYGKYLEWGPRKKAWIIRAKYFKALRFIWPNAPMGGFTAKVTGKTKGGESKAALTANVFHFRSVRHRWTRKQLRPHIGPAVKKIRPEFERYILRIPHQILKERR